MLSYQHIYHAGNFADVHKHAILALLLKTLVAKTPKLAVLDTHAGRGVYDLGSEEAQKTAEFESGALHFWNSGTLPQDLRDVVTKFNPEGGLKVWPGSAAIARELLRPSDRLVCIERHPGEFDELKRALGGKPNTTILKDDGFEALETRLPLSTRKGLVIVDPSFEVKAEYAQTAKQVHKAWRKWNAATYLVWYPVLEAGGHKQMLLALRKTDIKDVLVSTLQMEKPPAENFRMLGAGVAIVNPPWPEAVPAGLTQAIAEAMPVKTAGEVFWLDNRRIDPKTGRLED